jgi:hypothetical protein
MLEQRARSARIAWYETAALYCARICPQLAARAVVRTSLEDLA